MKKKNQKSLKRRMNRTAILSFFTHREKLGDVSRLSYETGFSPSHIYNVRAGRRTVPTDLANAMYYLTRRRVKNEEYA